ncbi:MerC domain-containing protein [Methylobacillus rhizosphaerae]|nr:MerC domain-containing protein [Methylobacillus rhizosphaerae]
MGNLVSWLCLIHCTVLPWLAFILPLSFLLDDSVHLWLFVALFPAAVFGAWSGWLHHGNGRPSLLLAIGLALVGCATFIPMSAAAEIALTIPGSLFLITGHTLNRRLQRIAHIAGARATSA